MVSSVTVLQATSQPLASAAEPSASSSTPGSQSASQSSAGNPKVAHTNPSYQFDAAAGVVVIQYRDESGKVDLSFPNQKQLDAYAEQRWGVVVPSTDSTVVT